MGQLAFRVAFILFFRRGGAFFEMFCRHTFADDEERKREIYIFDELDDYGRKEVVQCCTEVYPARRRSRDND